MYTTHSNFGVKHGYRHSPAIFRLASELLMSRAPQYQVVIVTGNNMSLFSNY